MKNAGVLLSGKLWVMLAVIGVWAGMVKADDVILNDGFEDGLSAWYIDGDGVATTNDPAYDGSQALVLSKFDGGVANLQKRFSDETAQNIELTMWVYIPAASANERTLEIQLRDPAQTDETPGPYVLFKEGAGLGVFTNFTGYSADFTKIADVVTDQWTKLVIKTSVASKKITLEYNGVTYDNGGEGYGWATETLSSLGKISIYGPSTGSNDVVCFVDDITVTEIVTPDVGTLFSDGFENGVANWGYAETWNGISLENTIVHGGLASLKLMDNNNTAPLMAAAFSNPNARRAIVSLWVYIPSASANQRTLEITLHDSTQATEEHGPYVLFKEDQGLGCFSNFGWWGADFTKIADVITDKWTNLVINADILTKTMTVTYDGTVYDNNGQGYPWGANTLSNLNKIVVWGPSTAVGATSYIDDLTITDCVVNEQVPGDANGDGMVDVGDLGILAANYGLASGVTWAQGDFNGDGAVDVGDLGILAANYGKGTVSGANYESDYAKVFGSAAENTDETSSDSTSSVCSSLGLSLVAGLVLLGLMMVKLEE